MNTTSNFKLLIIALFLILSSVYCEKDQFYGACEGSECTAYCDTGRYLLNLTSMTEVECLDCPQGFYCLNDFMIACPKGSVATREGSTRCEFCPLHQWSTNGVTCSTCKDNEACSSGVKVECGTWKYVAKKSSKDGKITEVCVQCSKDSDHALCRGFKMAAAAALNQSATTPITSYTIPLTVAILVSALVLVCAAVFLRKSKLKAISRQGTVMKQEEKAEFTIANSQTLFSLSNYNLPKSHATTPKLSRPQPRTEQIAPDVPPKTEAVLEPIDEEDDDSDRLSEIDIN